MCQSLENGPKLRFWANFDIIMLIMRERDFSRACGFLQMLINTLYLLNMRYGTDHYDSILSNVTKNLEVKQLQQVVFVCMAVYDVL